MCYYLYGAINRGADADDYDKIIKSSKFHFNSGNEDDVNSCVEKCEDTYRITYNHCDCNSAVGSKHTNKNEICELTDILLSLKAVRGIKYVLLSKNWYDETNTKQETVHINDIDIPHFLANAEDNCLYKIELYPKYY